MKLSKLPYLLMLQLKRFDLNYETLARVKLNDRVCESALGWFRWPLYDSAGQPCSMCLICSLLTMYTTQCCIHVALVPPALYRVCAPLR